MTIIINVKVRFLLGGEEDYVIINDDDGKITKDVYYLLIN